MTWRYVATRLSDGVIGEGVVVADTRSVANLRALDEALDALGDAELTVVLTPVLPPALADKEARS